MKTGKKRLPALGKLGGIVSICLLLGVTAGCGDEGANEANVSACKTWVEKTSKKKCGDQPLSKYTDDVNCSIYGDITDDLTAYFDCLYTSIQCKPVGTDKTETEDLSGWPGCYSKVVANSN